MSRLLKSITGGDVPRHIVTIRHGCAKRTISAVEYRETGNARQLAAAAEVGNNPMQQQTFATASLLEMAGVAAFTIRWPTQSDVLAIARTLQRDGYRSEDIEAPPQRIFAATLERLAGIDRAKAQRLALADMPAVAAMFAHAFREMRAALPAGDPRLAERLPKALAGEAA